MAVRWKDETEATDEKQQKALQPPNKNQFAVALGRLGGLKGGKARAAKLSAARRREIARLAARARWKKKSTTKTSKTRKKSR